MGPSSERRHRLSPVLADEPLVGERLTQRLRIVLLAVVLAFVLTNAASYLIGQAVRADAERDNRARIAAIERKIADDLEERRQRRDAEVARQDEELRKLRESMCTLADRAQPRDEQIRRLRERYDCTGDPPAASPAPTRPPGSDAAPSGGRPGAATPSPPARSPQRPQAPAAPTRPPATPPATPPRPTPTPTPPPPQEPDDDGLICLPIIGCIL